MKKWQKINRNGIGRFGYEIFQSNENPQKYWINIYIYDKKVDITGDKEIVSRKIQELSELFNELSQLFPDEPIRIF